MSWREHFSCAAFKNIFALSNQNFENHLRLKKKKNNPPLSKNLFSVGSKKTGSVCVAVCLDWLGWGKRRWACYKPNDTTIITSGQVGRASHCWWNACSFKLKDLQFLQKKVQGQRGQNKMHKLQERKWKQMTYNTIINKCLQSEIQTSTRQVLCEFRGLSNIGLCSSKSQNQLSQL